MLQPETLHTVIAIAAVIGLYCLFAAVRGILHGIRDCVSVVVFPFRCTALLCCWVTTGCRNDPPDISPLLEPVNDSKA